MKYSPNKNFISMADYTGDQIAGLISTSEEIRLNRELYKDSMIGLEAYWITTKDSLRTDASVRKGVKFLGGNIENMNGDRIFSRGFQDEEVRCLAGFSEGSPTVFIIRADYQQQLEKLAEALKGYNASVISALTGGDDGQHPLQTLADLKTMFEYGLSKNQLVGWLGDPTNVCNSLIIGCSRLRIPIIVSCPEGYKASDLAEKIGKEIGMLTYEHDPVKMLKEVSFVNIDTFFSMPPSIASDDEIRTMTEKKKKDLPPYKLTKKLLREAGNEPYVLHCLPRHKDVNLKYEEIERSLADSKLCLKYQQSDNRLHTFRGVLYSLWADYFKKNSPSIF